MAPVCGKETKRCKEREADLSYHFTKQPRSTKKMQDLDVYVQVLSWQRVERWERHITQRTPRRCYTTLMHSTGIPLSTHAQVSSVQPVGPVPLSSFMTRLLFLSEK
ncbi:unnamed protein product [Ectocarpus sp. 12 AP-2014]